MGVSFYFLVKSEEGKVKSEKSRGRGCDALLWDYRKRAEVISYSLFSISYSLFSISYSLKSGGRLLLAHLQHSFDRLNGVFCYVCRHFHCRPFLLQGVVELAESVHLHVVTLVA